MVLCVLRESRAFLPSFTTSKKKKPNVNLKPEIIKLWEPNF